MGKYYININNITIQKVIGLVKGRKKSELVEAALLFYFKNANKNEIEKFVNPIFKDDFFEFIKELKEEEWKKF